MEEYVNKETIIKNETYEIFKDSVLCPICQCLMLEPVICLSCQNYFCKKCIECLIKKEGRNSCPNNCQNPIIKNVIEKNNLLFKLKFKCIKGCKEEIFYNDLEKHYKTNCLLKMENKKKMKILTKSQIQDLKNKNSIEYVTSKHNIIIIF